MKPTPKTPALAAPKPMAKPKKKSGFAALSKGKQGGFGKSMKQPPMHGKSRGR